MIIERILSQVVLKINKLRPKNKTALYNDLLWISKLITTRDNFSVDADTM